MTKTNAQIAREAADHIEKVGLYQGGTYFDRGYLEHPAHRELPCCTIGAAMVVIDGSDASLPSFDLALARFVGGAVTHWSDSTPQDEVVATLRRFADERDGITA